MSSPCTDGFQDSDVKRVPELLLQNQNHSVLGDLEILAQMEEESSGRIVAIWSTPANCLEVTTRKKDNNL